MTSTGHWQPLIVTSRVYDALVGTGGLGSGQFFALTGDHTLGREESRGGRFVDRRDYCKLHIISHYVHTLLGSSFATYPVGKLGADPAGNQIMNEMTEAGMSCKFVEQLKGEQTLFSFCFIYPDGSGGNLTTDNSACSKVDEDYISRATPVFEKYSGRGIGLAVPEVPLGARAELLSIATENEFFRAASYTVEEIHEVPLAELLTNVDLLAVNADEAAAIAGLSPETTSSADIVHAAVDRVATLMPDVMLSITAGKCGSWTWDGKALDHRDVIDADVVSTAGAGDAHMAGIIVGLVTGLTLPDAHQLAALIASLSVTSPHTIHPEIDRASLRSFADSMSMTLNDSIGALLG